MIDEIKILASKFWKKVTAIQREYALNDYETGYLMSLIIGLYCIRDKSLKHPSDLSNSLLEAINHLINIGDSPHRPMVNDHFRTVLDRLRHLLDIPHSTNLPAFNMDVVPEFFRLTSSFAYSSSTESSDNLLGLFEYSYRRFVGGETEIEFHNGERFAYLVDALLDGRTPLWEYFIGIGDAGVYHSQKHPAQRFVFGTVFPSYEFLLRMRLWLHGTQVKVIKPEETPPRSFVFINHPAQHVTQMPFLEGPLRRPSSALAALANLWNRSNTLSAALVVIPSIDRSINGRRAEFRRELVMSGRLTAVIDLPLISKPGRKNQNVSIWLIEDSARNSSEVLCIDATKIRRMEFSANLKLSDIDEMRYIAAIINCWRDRLGISTSSIQVKENDALSVRFAREFKSGYRDVQGLCRAVPNKEFEERKFSLQAATYIQKSQEQEWLSAIDSSPILEKLDKHTKNGFRAYVIGNNGAGKSLLLRELIRHLKNRKLRSVGISFGMADRFPFSSSSSENSKFIYRGARTGKAAINHAAAAEQLAKLTKILHIDQVKLDVFNDTMALLGFQRRHYLVPLNFLPPNGEHADEQLAELIQLTDDATANASLLELSLQKHHQLGLMRVSEGNQVAVFETLSSGEQQILTLVIKLLAEASSGTVILIDEPEISLHVAWQRALPRVFNLIGMRLQCSMVIATHSPVLIASATDKSDFCFVAKGATLTPIEPKRNQSVETVLFDDFETYTENNRRVHERCARIVSDVITFLNSEAVDRREKIEIVRNELDMMEKIVDSSTESVSDQQKRTDLELIRRAKSAIDEILHNATVERLVGEIDE